MTSRYISQNSKKKWFRNHWVMILLVVIIIWIGYGTTKAFFTLRATQKLQKEYQQEYDILAERQKILEEKKELLITDRGIESEIRDRYRVTKPNEQLVLVVDNQETQGEDPVSFWQRLRNFVGF